MLESVDELLIFDMSEGIIVTVMGELMLAVIFASVVDISKGIVVTVTGNFVLAGILASVVRGKEDLEVL